MKLGVFVFIASAVAEPAEEDNTMLQIGEHVNTEIKRPKKAGRVALQSFCQNFCVVQPDNELTDDVDEGASGNCEGNGKDKKGTGFYRCPKDPATGNNERGCEARDTLCQQFCKVRGGWAPKVTGCSRKAGMHDHLCDLESGFGNMELVLRRHCTKECDDTLMTKGNGGQNGALCRKVCEPNPNKAGKYQLQADAENLICLKSIYKAWECQEENCGTRTRKLDDCIDNNNVNKKDRVKNECRPGGIYWDNLVQCAEHKCADRTKWNNDFVWDVRQEFLDECGVEVRDNGAVFSHCLIEKTRDFFVGQDVSSLTGLIDDTFEAV